MYKRRVKIFLAVIAAVLLLLGVRIGHLQIGRGEEYRKEFERSMREVHLLSAARGQITDRTGKILAADLPCKDLCLEYAFLSGDAKWAARQVRQIQRETGLSRQEANSVYHARADYTWRLADQLSRDANADLGQVVGRVIDSVRRIRDGVQRRGGVELLRVREELEVHPVAPGLSEEAAVRVEADIQAGRTVGALLRPGHKRFYPYGEVACHVIGLTGAVTEEDLVHQNLFPLSTDSLTARREQYEADESIGNSGLEKMCEPLLRGRRGYRVLNTGGREPEEVEGEPAQAGADVHTTLDLELQKALTQRLRDTGYNGAAVVLSIDHGEVLAMASVPTYDLNRYHEESPRLNGDDVDFPLLNRAVGVRYPPGSSIKPIIALAGLTTGRVTAATTVVCTGYLFDTGEWRGKCTGQHGEVDLHKAIMKSCNIYFFHLGEKLTLPVLYDWFGMFGLRDRAGTGLPEEKAGNTPSQAWMAAPANRAHLAAEAMQEGIGQGVLGVTPLHMANVMATIARDGRFVPPMLVLEGRGERAGRDLHLPTSALQAVREGMRSVVGTPGGTGYNAFHAAPGQEPLGFEVCGKSGTAQVEAQRADLNHDGRVEPGEIVREGTKMVWFVGFAPAQRPKVAFAVVLEHLTEGSGGANAAPVARDLLRWCKDLGYLNE
jgi:penicillin-binding protein 2